MSDQPIPPITWIGLIVVVAVIIGMSYFAMKAGNRTSKVREQQSDGDTEHHEGNR